MNDLEDVLDENELVEVMEAVWEGLQIQEEYDRQREEEEKKGSK